MFWLIRYLLVAMLHAAPSPITYPKPGGIPQKIFVGLPDAGNQEMPFDDRAGSSNGWAVRRRSFHVTANRVVHSLAFRKRNALPITETELKLMAAPAMMGLRSTPKNG